MNSVFTPNPGDVYYAPKQNKYRMYVKVQNKEDLLCVNLSTGEAYPHIKDNGLVDPKYEVFVFNMADIVTSNT